MLMNIQKLNNMLKGWWRNMMQINVEMIKQYKEYVGFFEGLGYMYKVGAELFVYNGGGLKKL